jgi:multidrug resistance efflux pump
VSAKRMSHWTNSEGCYFKYDENGEYVFSDEYDRLAAELAEAQRQVATFESTKTELEIALRDTLAALKRANADLAAAFEIIEHLNRLACVAMLEANRDGHEYDISAELDDARAFLSRMEVNP